MNKPALFLTATLLVLALILPSSARAASIAQDQIDSGMRSYYFYWKAKYLTPSSKVTGDYKVNYDGSGATVSEAMGYGMLLTVYMADVDQNARACFDGLNRFRERYPSRINPAFMCWKIPGNENAVNGDCATDGDLDMAFALLLAHRKWGDAAYWKEAKDLVHNIGTTLVRPDFSLRLGDWNSEPGQTRPSDFMPTHFRAFEAATGDHLWSRVESKCYSILGQLQTKCAPATGLVPDFAICEDGEWKPAKPRFLEGRNDGQFNYNSCRVPWRIGWAATSTGDPRARRILERFMKWVTANVAEPEDFRAGYQLDGTRSGKSDFGTACFISPTGVAALATGNQRWFKETLAYAMKSREGYYEDSVNLLCMLVMSGKAWLPAPGR